LKDLKDYGIPIVIVFVTFLGILLAPGSILLHPTYEIEYEALHNGTIETFTITNTGWIQAKNVKINLHPGDISYLQYEDCPEGDFGENWDSPRDTKMEFDRMSSNLSCTFMVIHIPEDPDASNLRLTEKMTITSDDSAAFVWTVEEKSIKNVSGFQELSSVIFFGGILTLIAYMLLTRLARRYQK